MTGKRISDEKLHEVTENLLDERQRAGGDAACIKGVASITDIFVELRESRHRIASLEQLVNDFRATMVDIYVHVPVGDRLMDRINAVMERAIELLGEPK